MSDGAVIAISSGTGQAAGEPRGRAVCGGSRAGVVRKDQHRGTAHTLVRRLPGQDEADIARHAARPVQDLRLQLEAARRSAPARSRRRRARETPSSLLGTTPRSRLVTARPWSGNQSEGNWNSSACLSPRSICLGDQGGDAFHRASGCTSALLEGFAQLLALGLARRLVGRELRLPPRASSPRRRSWMASVLKVLAKMFMAFGPAYVRDGCLGEDVVAAVDVERLARHRGAVVARRGRRRPRRLPRSSPAAAPARGRRPSPSARRSP